MRKAEFRGVQHLARDGAQDGIGQRGRQVHAVAEHGMSGAGQVFTDLVRPARLDDESEMAGCPVRAQADDAGNGCSSVERPGDGIQRGRDFAHDNGVVCLGD